MCPVRSVTYVSGRSQIIEGCTYDLFSFSKLKFRFQNSSFSRVPKFVSSGLRFYFGSTSATNTATGVLAPVAASRYFKLTIGQLTMKPDAVSGLPSGAVS